jgi:hypothetical protein
LTPIRETPAGVSAGVCRNHSCVCVSQSRI